MSNLLARGTERVFRLPSVERTRTAAGGPRFVGMNAGGMSLLVLGVVSIANIVWPRHALLAAAWTLASVFYVHRRYSIFQIAHPVVIVFYLGLLPAALGYVALWLTPAYSVSSKSESWTWALMFLALAAAHVSSTSGELFRERHLTSPPGMMRDSIALLMVAVAALVYVLHKTGLALLAKNAEASRVTAAVGSGTAGTVATALSAVAVPLAGMQFGISLARSGSSQRRLRGLLAVLVVVLLALTALTGTRAFVLRGLVGFAVGYAVVRAGKLPKVAVAAGVPAAALLVSVLGVVRLGNHEPIARAAARRLAADPYSSSLIFRYADHHGRLGGAEPFRVAFRTYLPGHQPLLSEVLKQALGLHFAGGGVAVPLAAEGYLVGGGLVVLVFAAIAGLVPGLLSRLVARSQTVPMALAALVVSIAWSGIFGTGIATTLAAYLVPELFVLGVVLIGWHLRQSAQSRRSGHTVDV